MRKYGTVWTLETGTRPQAAGGGARGGLRTQALSRRLAMNGTFLQEFNIAFARLDHKADDRRLAHAGGM